MREKIKKVLKRSLGVICIAIGIIGLFMPILQGWLFILIGLTLLESDFLKKEIHILREKIKEWMSKKKKAKTR